MKNPFRELLALVDALPEERRAFLAGSARATTTDSKRPCGCVIGQNYPPHRDERHVITNYTPLFGRDPEFRAWAEGLGLDADRVTLVQALNDRYFAEPSENNSEAVARARFAHVRAELAVLAERFDRGERPSVAELPMVVL